MMDTFGLIRSEIVWDTRSEIMFSHTQTIGFNEEQGVLNMLIKKDKDLKDLQVSRSMSLDPVPA